MYTQSTFTNLYFNFPLKSEKDLYKQIFPGPQAKRVLDLKENNNNNKTILSCYFIVSELKLIKTIFWC